MHTVSSLLWLVFSPAGSQVSQLRNWLSSTYSWGMEMVWRHNNKQPISNHHANSTVTNVQYEANPAAHKSSYSSETNCFPKWWAGRQPPIPLLFVGSSSHSDNTQCSCMKQHQLMLSQIFASKHKPYLTWLQNYKAGVYIESQPSYTTQ